MTTPEPRGGATALDHSLQIFWTWVERLPAAADQQQPLHQVEETLFRDLLARGFSVVRAFLALAGEGEVGPTWEVADEANSDGPRVLPRRAPPRSRPDLSIVDATTIARACYGRDRGEAAPLDARLHRPRRQDSYLVQQGLGAFLINDAHAAAIPPLPTSRGRGIAVTASEDLNRAPASEVVVFQGSPPVPAPDEEGPLRGVTADCQGVPLVRSALGPEEETRPAETAVPPATANPRRGKGQKANTKQMAAVGAVSTIAPFGRTADDVSDEVRREQAATRRPRPAPQRVRAELRVGQVALFLWLADEVGRRNPEGIKPLIFLADRERA